KVKEPLGIESILRSASSPSFITEPFPNCFSILRIASSKAFCLSLTVSTSSNELNLSYIVLLLNTTNMRIHVLYFWTRIISKNTLFSFFFFHLSYYYIFFYFFFQSTLFLL